MLTTRLSEGSVQDAHHSRDDRVHHQSHRHNDASGSFHRPTGPGPNPRLGTPSIIITTRIPFRVPTRPHILHLQCAPTLQIPRCPPRTDSNDLSFRVLLAHSIPILPSRSKQTTCTTISLCRQWLTDRRNKTVFSTSPEKHFYSPKWLEGCTLSWNNSSVLPIPSCTLLKKVRCRLGSGVNMR